ncbi:MULTISPECIES: hypothetical protein [unclassified Bradyrhizobium]|uniref:hypothetical protein n=2 Tax=Bradyrhizobium TaxID=374 RepID=UPI003396C575
MTMKVANGDHVGATKTYRSAWVVVTGLSCAFLLACNSVALFLPARYFENGLLSATGGHIVVVCLIVQSVLILQSSISLAGFRCCGMYAFGTMMQAWIMLAEGLAIIACAAAGGSPLHAAISSLLCRLAGALALHISLRRKVPWLSLGFDPVSFSDIRRLGHPSLGIIALSAAQATFLQGMTIVVGIALSSSSAAVFSAVRTVTRIGVQSTSLLHRAVSPEFSIVSARGDRKAKAKLVAITLLLSIGSLLILASALLISGPKLVELWSGNTMHPPFSLVMIMTGVMLVHGIWIPLANYLVAVNRHADFSYLYLGLSLAAVLVAYPLTLVLGEAGAAVSLLGLDLIMAAIVLTLTFMRLCKPHELRIAFSSTFRTIGDNLCINPFRCNK